MIFCLLLYSVLFFVNSVCFFLFVFVLIYAMLLPVTETLTLRMIATLLSIPSFKANCEIWLFCGWLSCVVALDFLGILDLIFASSARGETLPKFGALWLHSSSSSSKFRIKCPNTPR